MPRQSRIPQEVEAKLLAPQPATLSAIARLVHLGPYRLRRRQPANLHTVYLDTPTLTLAHHGIALRLRRDQARWEASLKWSGKENGMIHARPELTVRLSRPPVFPFSLPPGLHNAEIPRLVKGESLQPILLSLVYRRRFAVHREEKTGTKACAELALDRVRLCSPEGKRRPVATYCEVEIEQEAGGTVQDLLCFAALLKERFALVPATGSKFSRGLSLLYGFAPLPGNLASKKRGASQRPLVRKKASPPTTQQ